MAQIRTIRKAGDSRTAVRLNLNILGAVFAISDSRFIILSLAVTGSSKKFPRTKLTRGLVVTAAWLDVTQPDWVRLPKIPPLWYRLIARIAVSETVDLG